MNSNKSKYDYFLKNSNNITVSDTEKIYNKYKLFRKGKVRDIFYLENDNELLLVASDRISAFNRHLSNIPYKGIVLNNISLWWFNQTKHIVPNHIIDKYDERSIKVKKCKIFPIEFVVRSYLTGSTETSIWKNYEKGIRNYCGYILPENMIKNQKLPNPILTPTTKTEKDELISKDSIIEKNIMTLNEWDICEKYAYQLFELGQQLSLKHGLILVDTKYEFGIDNSNNIILVDEIHTPDSSRFWVHHNYQELYEQMKEPESYDKEIIRKWINNNYINPYDMNINIDISNEIKLELATKYLQLHKIITENEFK